MPELPDVLLYQAALENTIGGQRLDRILIRSPFVLRTFLVPAEDVVGKLVVNVSRLGKRLVLELSDDLFVVIHLMIAGRFHWRKPMTLPRAKADLAAFQFQHGTLMMTEASSNKRAGIWIVQGRESLTAIHTAGANPLTVTLDEFAFVLKRTNNTLKRALTDPQRFDGIGNAYSDEILHTARLSPLLWTSRVRDDQMQRLWDACRDVLTLWIQRLQTQNAGAFPERVTAFRPEMNVHGKFGKPCPVCHSTVQRIRYSENECNYCATCQTEGKLLADRSLSRLLKDDWPKTLEEWESNREQ